jgi:hypothetical protein
LNKHDVYMEFPEGMKKIEGMAIKLEHSMNGTKQGVYNWHELADKLLVELGFTATISAPCLYYRWTNNKLALVGLYVDDFRIAAQDASELKEIEQYFQSKYKIKSQPPNWWLNLKIDHDMDKGILEVTQETYILELLKTFNMSDCKIRNTPAEPGLKLIKTADDEDTGEEAKKFPYRSITMDFPYLPS